MDYPAFEVFGTQHLITLMICAAVIYGYPKFFQIQSDIRRKDNCWGNNFTYVNYLIFSCLTFHGKGEFPMHMCDFSQLAMIYYLLNQKAPKILFHCAYFWGICGATMALATPDLEYGFPHGEYSPFFWGHSLIFVGSFLRLNGQEMKVLFLVIFLKSLE